MYQKDEERLNCSGGSVLNFSAAEEGVCLYVCVCVIVSGVTHTGTHTQAPFFLRLSKTSWAVSAGTGSPSVRGEYVGHTRAHRPAHWYAHPTGPVRHIQVSISMQDAVKGSLIHFSGSVQWVSKLLLSPKSCVCATCSLALTSKCLYGWGK